MAAADNVVTYATAELGKPYVWGNEGPASFDCSGLVQYVYQLAGIMLPRTAAEQQKATTPVSTPRPGDLVFYGRPAHHVGVYVGGGKMIDAPDVGQVVKVDNVGAPTGYGRVPGAGTLTDATVGTVSDFFASAGTGIRDLLDWARTELLTGLGLLLGLGLVGIGLYRAVNGDRGGRRGPVPDDDGA